MNSCCGEVFIPWLDKSEKEREKERREKEELERKAERRITQGRLARFLWNCPVKEDIVRLSGVSSEMELMALIVDEIGDGE